MGKRSERQLTKEDIQMEKKQMKRCSAPYIIRELQIKTVRKYHYTTTAMTITILLEWLKSQTLTTSNAGENVEQQELSFIVDGNEKRV